MKQRFVTNKNGSPFRNTIISIAMFVAIFCLFWFGVSAVSDKTAFQEKQTLEAAINRNIVHCYAIEGAYPEDLNYLKEHYGLTYDESKFFVDYQIEGTNIMPDVTIVDKGDTP